MSKCPKCGGYGMYMSDDIHVICEQCHGSGEVEQTNEEWIHSMTTEQLAELLLNAIQDCKSCASGIDIAEKDDMPCPFGGCWDVQEVLEWLKQPHHNEVEK